ncbi:MAG: LuxR C-terminal-related transcriptional regulator [Myxococcales bacterium]|nr:LuxR C-terminal-related transcriptional regulator [Myxococcales bacterium]
MESGRRAALWIPRRAPRPGSAIPTRTTATLFARQELLAALDELTRIDPVRSYPGRAAQAVARLASARSFRLELSGAPPVTRGATPAHAREIVLPLRDGRRALGTFRLYVAEDPSAEQLRDIRWAARIFCRGIGYARRLGGELGRRGAEDVNVLLRRTPLTPRERDVVAHLVAGRPTRVIAERLGLTVSTVNTYLKRIFGKLGVHSRVELVARLVGTSR